MKKSAFTLAEVMIVLTVIGVLTAILLPVARQSMPDENLMKFKKAHNTLGTVIRELVTSDKYYLDGDLGVKPDGSWVEDAKYFLSTFCDVLNIKEKQMPEIENGMYDPNYVFGLNHNLDDIKARIDNSCKSKQDDMTSYVLMPNGTYYYQFHDGIAYGARFDWFNNYRNPFYSKWDGTTSEAECQALPTRQEQDDCARTHFVSGFYWVYAIFCLDIDRINKDEDPFGYGIRIDGKILTGKRADEWLARDVNEE